MSKSILEVVFAGMAREAHLPPWEREYRPFPNRRFRLDFAWPDATPPVAVEIDGGKYAPHGGRHAQDGDREKHNLLVIAGWRVLRLSGDMLTERWVEAVKSILDANRSGSV